MIAFYRFAYRKLRSGVRFSVLPWLAVIFAVAGVKQGVIMRFEHRGRPTPAGLRVLPARPTKAAKWRQLEKAAKVLEVLEAACACGVL